ncbi:hypothetical protein M8494_05450 [Serratia ureilytica]
MKALRFEKYSAMPAIGVNGAYCLRRQVDFHFYVIVDMGFIDNRPEIARCHSTAGAERSPPCTAWRAFSIVFGQAAIGCRLAIVEDAACKILPPPDRQRRAVGSSPPENGVEFCIEPTLSFSQDIRCGIFDAGTVAYWALQIIAYLGFRQLFIAGWT